MGFLEAQLNYLDDLWGLSILDSLESQHFSGKPHHSALNLTAAALRNVSGSLALNVHKDQKENPHTNAFPKTHSTPSSPAPWPTTFNRLSSTKMSLFALRTPWPCTVLGLHPALTDSQASTMLMSSLSVLPESTWLCCLIFAAPGCVQFVVTF